MGILIDLFDHSGNAAEPYRKNGWIVIQVDLKLGTDILTWDYQMAIFNAIKPELHYLKMPDFGLLAAIPCTDYATSGAKHFAKKDANGQTKQSQLLVKKVEEIKTFIEKYWKLKFWKIENPRTRIHKLNPWIGKITQKFNPCDFAGYINPTFEQLNSIEHLRQIGIKDALKSEIQLVNDLNLYNKETWLFGNFNKLQTKPIASVWKENPGWVLYGGKSERTKELRSIDPKGYCLAFYEANH
ncbi:MAG: hypothetical protein P4L31_07350 [Candidatus Babeliales bacterium]|nr:hypothetical protein [Candidatus Babeliales bacterium]